MKIPIKLIALDLDGTLLDSNDNISPNTNLKLKELVERGIHVVIATGRTHRSADNVQKRFSLDVPIISYNGGKISIPSKGELLNNKIPKADAIKIIQYAEGNNIFAKAYIDDVMYLQEDDERSVSLSRRHGIEYKVQGSLSQIINQDVNMIVIMDRDKACPDIDGLFDDMDLSITKSTPWAYEFMASGCTKGRSLEVLSKHLGIEREAILAVGNALNDLEMLQFAGTGIAMKNSDSDLLEVWDNLSDYTNNEEGVYQIIKDI